MQTEPLPPQTCWAPICNLAPIILLPLTDWLAESDGRWNKPASETKPTRIHQDGLPMHLVQPIMGDVLLHFPGAIADSPMLSRMLSGQSHPMHVDRQRADWITRVHVPLTTNSGAWLMFEPEGKRIHFEVGMAYRFNTHERHSFGNDGEDARVHLIFEVLRDDR